MSSASPAEPYTGDEPWHGATSDVGYTRHGCRCPRCKKAHRDRVWLYRQQLRATGRPLRRRPALPQPGDWVRHPRLGWGVVVLTDTPAKRLRVRHDSYKPGCVREYRARIITGHHGPDEKHKGAGHSLSRGRPFPRTVHLTEDDRLELCRLRELGWTYAQLAAHFEVSPTTACRIVGAWLSSRASPTS